ncbi:LiaI-LiaF-like domain-containing protein [Salarchaeum sp. JOR-1]|uniref:LiaF transmembrane domain-containing protein n=1 Tax=Salarchaeum sp. JOR-1 TaxID=2599399 RepID=UPI0011989082|nr:DUF5668 domain-containing protein [Salarchaeum sp. JOR-1]QDX39744.1 hypothetical protein FQU85_02095 [Salarchaeum sp. JOR-1]
MARSSRRWGSAGFFVLLGIALLLFTTDAVESIDPWTWFPGLFVLLGAWSLVASRGRNLTGPVLVIAVAGAFLLRNLNYLPDDFIGTWWPAVFVLLGLLILLNRGRRRRGHTASANGEFTSVSIFGGDSQHVGGTDFRGGDVVAIFGGPTIDLRDATAVDKPAVLEIVSVFGGAEIRVPEDWTVKAESVNIFGGLEDTRRNPGTADEPDLVVTGVSVFGGVELTD